MADKTLVELAVEFNIEINKLRNKINYEKRKGNVIGFKKNGVWCFNVNDVERLKVLFNLVEKPVEFNNELNIYIEQIEDYKAQIKTLSRLLENQQILTKQALDDKQQLQIELTESQNKSFWQRWFGKKDKQV